MAGVDIDKNRNATCVIIERTFKHARKHYCLKSADSLFNGDLETGIETQLEKLHGDRHLTVTKRVFSQDRRPARHVRVPPTLIVRFFSDIRCIDALRKKGIPAEGISIREGMNWHKENYGQICLGNN